MFGRVSENCTYPQMIFDWGTWIPTNVFGVAASSEIPFTDTYTRRNMNWAAWSSQLISFSSGPNNGATLAISGFEVDINYVMGGRATDDDPPLDGNGGSLRLESKFIGIWNPFTRLCSKVGVAEFSIWLVGRLACSYWDQSLTMADHNKPLKAWPVQVGVAPCGEVEIFAGPQGRKVHGPRLVTRSGWVDLETILPWGFPKIEISPKMDVLYCFIREHPNKHRWFRLI